MGRQTKDQADPAKRMANYRRRMRDSGLRPVQLWLPDTRSPEFVDECRRQAEAVAAHDPAGDEIMHFLEGVRDWPEAPCEEGSS
jgi:hypothetical protein